MEGRNALLQVLALVFTSLDQQGLVACDGETSCQRAATRTGADDDIFVVLKGGDIRGLAGGVLVEVVVLVVGRFTG